METYSITLMGRIFNKKIKNVKGHGFPKDINVNDHRYLQIVLSDETILLINLSKFNGYKISKDLFYIKAREVKEETRGQADLTRGTNS